jgi:hypothetical protein
MVGESIDELDLVMVGCAKPTARYRLQMRRLNAECFKHTSEWRMWQHRFEFIKRTYVLRFWEGLYFPVLPLPDQADQNKARPTPGGNPATSLSLAAFIPLLETPAGLKAEAAIFLVQLVHGAAHRLLALDLLEFALSIGIENI